MAKRLFLLVILCLIEVINVPYDLAAMDSFVVGEPEFHAVETVALVEPASAATSEAEAASYGTAIVNRAEIAVRPEVVTATTAVATTAVQNTVSVPQGNYISVAGRNLAIVDVGDTMVDAGNHVNKYGEKFLYGHNSAGVFGGLVNVYEGDVFTVSYGGVVRNYRVAERGIFEKVSDTALRRDGAEYKMRAIANGRGKYDMVLMTCYGTVYGNGDASHRLILFANAI